MYDRVINSELAEVVATSFFHDFSQVKSAFEKLPENVRSYFEAARQNISPAGFKKCLISNSCEKKNYLELYRYGILQKAFKNFALTRTNNESEILDALKSLSPTYGVTPIELLALTLYINKESENKGATINEPHVASFGTGGDDKKKTNKTINITTISTLLAASFLEAENLMKYKIVKVSSKAVTGNFGGADIGSQLHNSIKIPNLFDLVTLGGSGFPYSQELVRARKSLDELDRNKTKVIDPYKILYPSASITAAEQLITGTRVDMLPDISRLTKYLLHKNSFKRRIIYGSTTGNDELMPGNNFVINSSRSDTEKFAITLPQLDRHSVEFIREKNTLDEQIRGLFVVLGLDGTRANHDILNLFAWNSAVQLPHEYITNSNEIPYEDGLKAKSAKMFKYLETLHDRGKTNPFAQVG